jgi:arginine decarboxylase
MLFPKPTRFFLCAGAAEGYTQLNAFDCALLEAGVGNTNLIRMSSILPPHTVRTDPIPLEPGSFVPIAYAYIGSPTPQEMIAAGVAIAIPVDRSLPGVIMEYSARGQAEDVERIVRSMAEEALKYRGYEIAEILSTSVQHRVESSGAAFAGVVLCE